MRHALLAAASVLIACVGCNGRSQPTAGGSENSAHSRGDLPDRNPADPGARAQADSVSGYLKGQLHAHSSGSGDSHTAPAKVAAWYAEHGFDFVVFTDHNVITRLPHRDDLLLFPGAELTHNTRSCRPEPEPGMACLLHVNALFVGATDSPVVPLRPREGDSRQAIYERSIALTDRLGGIAQLNHPNFHYGADGPLIAHLAGRGLALVEIANEAFDSNNQGDARHPSTEALWDAALSQGARVFGVATDDAHHYYDAEQARARGEDVFTGDRGFVMVRAARDREAIVAAIKRGDFYSSTGVLLRRVHADADTLTVEAHHARDHEFIFIGQHGAELDRVRGRSATYQLTADQPYVRALVTDGSGARAFTQPLFREDSSAGPKSD